VSLLNKFSFAALFILVAGLQFQCTPTINQNSSLEATCEEDLSVHRKDYPLPDLLNEATKESENYEQKERIEPTNHIQNELDSVLSIIKKSRERIKYINGLTIQVYSGNNRELANSIKQKLYSLSDSYNPIVKYDQPNYKVSIGEYFTRFEANKDYTFLRKEFSQALLVPKKILIQSNN
jgi:hypothetical protein